MAVLHEFDTRSVVAELIGRGLELEQIEHVLERMIGSDWKDVSVSDWQKRLVEQSLIAHDDSQRFLDDLVALVNGRSLLDDLKRRRQRWGRA